MSGLFLPEGGILPYGITPRRTREILLPPQTVKFESYVGWELIRDGKTIAKAEPQKNLITTAGLNALGGAATLLNMLNWCGVGTSGTAPAFSDTSLGAQVGSRTTANGGTGDNLISGPSYDYYEYQRTRLFLEAEAIGNLTEVGFFDSAAGGIMWNHQKFKDDLGVETVVPKTAADQLKVTVKVRVYPNKTTSNQTLSFDIVGTPTSTAVANRALDVDAGWSAMNFGAWNVRMVPFETNVLPAVTDTLTGTFQEAGTITKLAYVAGTFQRDVQLVMDPAQCNYPTGIGSIEWGIVDGFSFQFCSTLNPKIPKTNVHRVTLVARASWARH